MRSAEASMRLHSKLQAVRRAAHRRNKCLQFCVLPATDSSSGSSSAEILRRRCKATLLLFFQLGTMKFLHGSRNACTGPPSRYLPHTEVCQCDTKCAAYLVQDQGQSWSSLREPNWCSRWLTPLLQAQIDFKKMKIEQDKARERQEDALAAQQAADREARMRAHLLKQGVVARSFGYKKSSLL